MQEHSQPTLLPNCAEAVELCGAELPATAEAAACAGTRAIQQYLPQMRVTTILMVCENCYLHHQNNASGTFTVMIYDNVLVLMLLVDYRGHKEHLPGKREAWDGVNDEVKRLGKFGLQLHPLMGQLTTT